MSQLSTNLKKLWITQTAIQNVGSIAAVESGCSVILPLLLRPMGISYLVMEKIFFYRNSLG
jgi:hypothetical protein